VAEPLLELLRPQRVLDPYASEVLGRERGDPREPEVLALSERVADADRPVVRDADDVAGEGGLDALAVAGEERRSVGEAEVAAEAEVPHLHPPLEPAGADAEEGDAVAVV